MRYLLWRIFATNITEYWKKWKCNIFCGEILQQIFQSIGKSENAISSVEKYCNKYLRVLEKMTMWYLLSTNISEYSIGKSYNAISHVENSCNKFLRVLEKVKMRYLLWRILTTNIPEYWKKWKCDIFSSVPSSQQPGSSWARKGSCRYTGRKKDISVVIDFHQRKLVENPTQQSTLCVMS